MLPTESELVMRLDRCLSSASSLSRSQVVKAIRSGRVSVNGLIVRDPSLKVDTCNDKILLDGVLHRYTQYRYFMLDKPSGVLTASRDRTQKTVIDLFPPDIRKQGIFAVGRLDKNTTGLLLLTNNGDFAHRILSPKSGIQKRYFASIDGNPSSADVERFREGLTLADGTRCLPADLEILEPGAVFVTVQEGKYHQVKRMLAAIGAYVLSLRRVSVGGLKLDEDLGEGNWKELSESDLCILFNS